MTDIYRKWLVLLAGLIFFMVDRLIKYALVSSQVLSQSRLIGYFENKNLAFSLPLPGILQSVFYFLVIIVILVVAGLFLASWRRSAHSNLFGYWLILLGAASNLIDRFRYNAVIDYLDLKYWPVFNLADVMIAIGVGLICYDLFCCQKVIK